MEKVKTGLAPREGWAAGPWDDEPDRVDWTDETTGYPCLMRRGRSGSWCGYVAIPPDHPLHRRSYGDIEDDINVHGGLTYSDACHGDICHVPAPGEPDDVWWFGFDCALAFDVSPGMDASLAQFAPHLLDMPGRRDIYWTVAMVRDECTSLAVQLAERA